MTLAETALGSLGTERPSGNSVNENLTKLCDTLRAEGFTDAEIVVFRDESALLRYQDRDGAGRPTGKLLPWQPLSRVEFYRLVRRILRRVDKALERLEQEAAEQ